MHVELGIDFEMGWISILKLAMQSFFTCIYNTMELLYSERNVVGIV